jgi:hypothetical protein
MCGEGGGGIALRALNGGWFWSTRWEASRDLGGLGSALCVRFREAALATRRGDGVFDSGRHHGIVRVIFFSAGWDV